MNRFGFGLGAGSFRVRLQLTQPKNTESNLTLKVELYVDEDWLTASAVVDKCNRSALARQSLYVNADNNGDWGEWVNGSLYQSGRPRMWYLAIANCEDNLQNYSHRFRYEFQASQEDGAEFSVEMFGVFSLNVIAFLGFSCFLPVFIKGCRGYYRSSDDLHPVIIVLAVAIVLQYLGQMFHTLHLWRYSYDGRGLVALEFFAELFIIVSQVMLATLLIIIALGYTLLQRCLGDLDLVIPVAFFLAVIHIMLIGLGKLLDDSAYVFHVLEGGIGWAVLVLRLLMWLWFLWAVNSTSAEGGMKLQGFLWQYRAAGSAYFLAFPLMFFFVRGFEPHQQNCVMTTGLLALQIGSNIWLASLFLLRGNYFKVSTLNASSLPGGACVGITKEE